MLDTWPTLMRYAPNIKIVKCFSGNLWILYQEAAAAEDPYIRRLYLQLSCVCSQSHQEVEVDLGQQQH